MVELWAFEQPESKVQIALQQQQQQNTPKHAHLMRNALKDVQMVTHSSDYTRAAWLHCHTTRHNSHSKAKKNIDVARTHKIAIIFAAWKGNCEKNANYIQIELEELKLQQSCNQHE